MKIEPPTESRVTQLEKVVADVVVVGGGLAGVCAAITAARAGQKVALIQDRPVLGGNASSEIRMWTVGATSHMGNNNRWAREGGVIDEILLENLHRNVDGNSLILDSILLDKVVCEPDIQLMLNTSVFEVEKSSPDTISAVRGFCSQNSTMYHVTGSMFVDASGDGIVGFQSGAAFRMGAERKEEFDEGFAPTKAYGELLGQTLYFYSKDAGRPVKFVPPSFALDDITKVPRWRNFKVDNQGCQLWWIEYGGRLDTVHDTEKIKWELWSIIYGVWNHIKNSGQFPDSENMTLEWVGTIPGKRESRRFEGDYILSQRDVIEQREHADAISYGGWAIDLHPADGVFSELPGCNQWHSKGVYQIPYRCLYSRNISNLFLTGRLISATHVAFGSTRVMLTCAHNGQAVGMAAAVCNEQSKIPRDLREGDMLVELRRRLNRIGHFIPRVNVEAPDDIASQATVTASSEYCLDGFEPTEEGLSLEDARAMLVPVSAGPMPKVGFWVSADATTEIELELRTSSRAESFTPDEVLSARTMPLSINAAATGGSGESANRSTSTATKTIKQTKLDKWQFLEVEFDVQIETDSYVMVCLMPNLNVTVALTDSRVTGVLSLSRKMNRRVNNSFKQEPPEGIGVESFEFWVPARRPDGKNLAIRFTPGLPAFSAQHVKVGPQRPTNQSNAWVASLNDGNPSLNFAWADSKSIQRIEFALDTDFDHGMESLLMVHPESEIPFCVPEIKVFDDSDSLVGRISENHLTCPTIDLDGVETKSLRLEFSQRDPEIPASAFRVRIYE